VILAHYGELDWVSFLLLLGLPGIYCEFTANKDAIVCQMGRGSGFDSFQRGFGRDEQAGGYV
jgi:hypothetical protein